MFWYLYPIHAKQTKKSTIQAAYADVTGWCQYNMTVLRQTASTINEDFTSSCCGCCATCGG